MIDSDNIVETISIHITNEPVSPSTVVNDTVAEFYVILYRR